MSGFPKWFQHVDSFYCTADELINVCAQVWPNNLSHFGSNSSFERTDIPSECSDKTGYLIGLGLIPEFTSQHTSDHASLGMMYPLSIPVDLDNNSSVPNKLWMKKKLKIKINLA